MSETLHRLPLPFWRARLRAALSLLSMRVRLDKCCQHDFERASARRFRACVCVARPMRDSGSAAGRPTPVAAWACPARPADAAAATDRGAREPRTRRQAAAELEGCAGAHGPVAPFETAASTAGRIARSCWLSAGDEWQQYSHVHPIIEFYPRRHVAFGNRRCACSAPETALGHPRCADPSARPSGRRAARAPRLPRHSRAVPHGKGGRPPRPALRRPPRHPLRIPPVRRAGPARTIRARPARGGGAAAAAWRTSCASRGPGPRHARARRGRQRQGEHKTTVGKARRSGGRAHHENANAVPVATLSPACSMLWRFHLACLSALKCTRTHLILSSLA